MFTRTAVNQIGKVQQRCGGQLLLFKNRGGVSPRQHQHQHPLLASSSSSSLRHFSVVNLSDESAVQKFRAINHKSILYFTAQWCPPCKMIKPIYEEMANEYKDSVAFGKIDVDENEDAAVEFEIQAVPTFVLFDGQNAVERFSGADADQLGKLVKDLAER